MSLIASLGLKMSLQPAVIYKRGSNNIQIILYQANLESGIFQN